MLYLWVSRKNPSSLSKFEIAFDSSALRETTFSLFNWRYFGREVLYSSKKFNEKML